MKKYRVEGMTCDGCVRSVERVVKAVDETLEVSVDLERGELVVEGAHDEAAVRSAVERAGFTAAPA